MDADITFPMNGIKRQEHGRAYANKPIAEIIVNGFFTVDKKWTVQYWNKAAEKILRVQASDIVGKNLWEAFTEFIPLEFYAVYHKAFEKNIPVHFQEYWGEMGAWFDVITYYCDNVLSVSFKSSNRSVDLEYPKTVEHQLQIKTGLYKFITEVTNDCLWEWDLINKEIFWIDGGHKRMLGYPVENALIPQSFWESLIHPGDRMRVMAGLDELFAVGIAIRWEREYRCKKADDSYVWLHDRGHIIYEGGQAVRMIGASLDITEKVALEKIRVAERLEWEKETINSLLKAQEEERAAVGNKLLDDVNQLLGAAKWHMEIANENFVNREKLLKESCNFILQAMGTVSQISRALAPPLLKQLGLIKSIKILTEDAASRYPVQFTVNDSVFSLESLDEKLLLDIYRIVQQQVNNIIQHADASLANIDISQYDDEIVLFIADNGNGYDRTKRKHGQGIKNITSLASLYNGSVTVLSSPGEGYTLQVIFRL